MMKRVARRVALSLSEAKRFTLLNDSAFFATGSPTFQWRYKNIFAQLPAANTTATTGSSYATVGSEIVDLLWKAKMVWRMPFFQLGTSPATNLFSYGTVYFRAYLIAANDEPNTAVGGATPPGTTVWNTYPAQYSSTDLGWFLDQDPKKPTLNGNNVRILKRWSKKYTPPVQWDRYASGDTNLQMLGDNYFNMTCKHKFRGKKTFEDNVFGDTDSNFPRGGTLRGWNYYLLCGWGSAGGLDVISQPSLTMDQFLYFKDP